MNEKLRYFLKKRGMDDESINRMEEDKIDTGVISLLDDGALQNYIPKYGDRVAVTAFAKASTDIEATASTSTCDDSPSQFKKRSLMERLKMKVKKGRTEHNLRSQSQQGNRNAKKDSRRVEIGWLDYDESIKGYKQVKAPSGGGTKHEAFNTDRNLDSIGEQVKDWFFPSGNSRRGHITDFEYFMTDATHVVLDCSITVEQMYQTSKCKMLRLYLATKRIKGSKTASDSEVDSSDIPLPKLNDSTTTLHSSGESLPEIKKRKTKRSRSKNSNLTTKQQNNNDETDTDELKDVCVTTDEVQMPILFLTSSDTEVEFCQIDGSSILQNLDETVVYDPLATGSTINLFQESDQVSGSQLTNPTTSTPRSPSPHHSPRSPTPPGDDNATVVTLHRSRIQQDMIAVFMDPAIVEMSIKVRFVDELGADNEGLSREAYSAFWKEFCLTCTCGEDERVPSLFPDYGKDEWEAVGRILLKGYIDTGVYPLQLSYAFSVALINGESAVSSDILIESIRMYLCETDRKIIDKAIDGEVLDDDDKDDFLDLLSRVNCHTIPSDDAVRPLILNIAHKELIQEPKYALDAIATSARAQLQSLLSSPDAVRKMYDSKKPTPRNVIKLIDSNAADIEEASALSYLKQFIRGLNNSMLKKFLRHVTGAEMLCTRPIQVTFNRMRGLGRAPQAHTCGPVLELPSTYSNYQELRKEFMSILESNYLKMDII